MWQRRRTSETNVSWLPPQKWSSGLLQSLMFVFVLRPQFGAVYGLQQFVVVWKRGINLTKNQRLRTQRLSGGPSNHQPECSQLLRCPLVAEQNGNFVDAELTCGF